MNFESEAMQFQQGVFVVIDGVPMTVVDVQKDNNAGGYRVHLKEAEMPRGTFPILTLFTQQESEE